MHIEDCYETEKLNKQQLEECKRLLQERIKQKHRDIEKDNQILQKRIEKLKQKLI